MGIDVGAPFSKAFINVMLQMGFGEVKVIRQETCGNKISTPGVVVIIGIIGDMHGNVIFALSEDSAKKIATTMMGMEMSEFDDMAQSAVSELSNMLAANACSELSMVGVKADVSTPTLMYGVFTANASYEVVTKVEVEADGLPICAYVSLEKA